MVCQANKYLIMGRSGIPGEYSSAQGLGIAGLAVSTATSITISTTARVIVDPCLDAVIVPPRTVYHSVVKQCMTRVAVKVPLAVDKDRLIGSDPTRSLRPSRRQD